MSQTTYLTLNEPEIKKCDSLLKEIENLREKTLLDKNFQENLENYYNELKELRNTFQKGQGIMDEIKFSWLKQLDSLSKRISNLDWNKEINAYLDRVSKNAKVNVFQFYTQYGIVAYEAIEYLESNNSTLTNELIESTITEFLKREVDQEKLNSFRKQMFEWIDKNLEKESSEIRYELKNFIKQYNNFEDISDLVYLINTRKEEIQKINSLVKVVAKSLKESEGFVLNKVLKTSLSDKGIIRKVFRFVNKNNNYVDVVVDGNLEISYKMGNYIGHACEKSANKIVEDIKKNGYSIQDMKVKRDLKTDKPTTRVSVVKSRTR